MEFKIDIENGRTSGDGMEQEDLGKGNENSEEPIDGNVLQPIEQTLSRTELYTGQVPRKKCGSTIPIPGLHTLYRRQSVGQQSRSLPPVVPKGKLYLLQPRLIQSTRTPDHKKNRAPKFIPFEPYPGAINPIIPINQTKIMKKNKNNLDINILVTQMSNMRTQEMDPTKDTTIVPNDNSTDHLEVIKLKQEMEKMVEDKTYLQSQLKFQVKVNSELKNLLVASVGEDLQTRVNVLTEDKLQLARALLDTANNLTTHTEQIEYLAGQCEVWRSKFLASSVMIEELARWKADLMHKNCLLTESNKKVLHLTSLLREMQFDLLKNLKFLAKLKILDLPSSDVLTLTSECLNITQQMVLHSGVGMPENLNLKSSSNNSLTDAEKFAIQALEAISQQLMATDEASQAIVGQAQRPYGPLESISRDKDTK